MSNQPQLSGEEKWDLVIESKTGLFDLHLKDVWRYRYLLVLFVKRDFISQYKQTILGPFWHILQPVLTSVMFMFIFGRVAKISTDDIPGILFYLSGLTLWNYFAACLTNTSNTFVANAAIFGKVYFPRLVLPLSIVVSNLVRFAIQFALLALVMVYYNYTTFPIDISVNLLYIPYLLILMAGLGLGAGIIISSLTTKYRDLAILMTFGVQLLMYATPIIYPISYVRDTSFEWIIKANPLTGLVETFRFALFNKGAIDGGDLLYSSVFMVCVLGIGLVIFNKVEKTFMDTV